MTVMSKLVVTKKKNKITKKVFIYLGLILLAIVCAGPFLWMLSTSFKTGQNIYDLSFIPENPTIAN